MPGPMFSPDTGLERAQRRKAIIDSLVEDTGTMSPEDWAQHAIDVLKPLPDQDKTVMLAAAIWAGAGL